MKFIVIGAGPAGEAAARAAARRKAEVVLIEKESVGGLCLNRGCIPSKTLLSFGKKVHQVRRSAALRNFVTVAPDLKGAFWKGIRKEKDRVILSLRQSLEKTFRGAGIRVLQGSARFVSADAVSVGGETVSFDKAVLACGSEPFYPPPLDAWKGRILNSDSVFELESVPDRLAVVGGGAIGCEFACLFHELGAQVTIVEKTAELLPGEDEAISRALRKSFEARGIRVLDSCVVKTLGRKGKEWEAALSNGTRLETEAVLLSTGRVPATEGLGLEAAGIQRTGRGVVTDSNFKTSNPNVYAVGDVNGLSLLAHAGSTQGEAAVAHAFGEAKAYEGGLIPRCLYSWPEAASVGLNARQAQEKGIETKSQRFFLEASGRALAEDEAEGLIQVVSDKKTDRLLGAQMIGAQATELIHVVAVALAKGMTRAELKEVIFAHPTLAEGIRGALER